MTVRQDQCCRLLKDWPSESPDPSTVSCGSLTVFQWICHRCEHTWNAKPSNRDASGSNCPQCWAKAKRSVRQPLLVQTNPELAAEWVTHANLRALESITAGSGYLATWQCLTCNEYFQSRVCNRVKGSGCPSPSCKTTRRLSPDKLQKRSLRDSQRGVQHGYVIPVPD